MTVFAIKAELVPMLTMSWLSLLLGDAMHIHRIGQSLTFCRGEVAVNWEPANHNSAPSTSHIDKGGENAVDAVVKQVINLPFGKHRQFGDCYFNLSISKDT